MQCIYRIILSTVLVFLLAGVFYPSNLFAGDIDADGVDDGQAFVDKDGLHDSFLEPTNTRDIDNIIILSNGGRRAYFGFYIFSSFQGEVKRLFQSTLEWAVGLTTRPEKRILLFTYNNDFVWPVTYLQEDGYLLYHWLLDNGYPNITTHAQGEIDDLSTEYFQDYDLILYWNQYGYDSTTAILSGVPFVSTSSMHARDMNIATGPAVRHRRSNFCVVDNNWPPTSVYSLGEIRLNPQLYVYGMELSENGVAVITTECQSIPVEKITFGGLRSLYR